MVEQTRSISDDQLLETAEKEKRILITRDKDFGELVYRLNKIHAGVVLIRLDGYDTGTRAEIVCHLINQFESQLQNSFSVIQPGMIRIR